MGVVQWLFKVLFKIVYSILCYVVGARWYLHDVIQRKHNCLRLVDKSGYVAIVTGGESGLGSFIVKYLAQCKMHVIIGCRDINVGNKWIEELRKTDVPDISASVYRLELKSLKSVKDFADEVIINHRKVDLLVNNAGIMFVSFSETEDGNESQFQVNYLGHFLLTQLLLKSMENSEAPRIVNVSSCMHTAALPINFDDLDMREDYMGNAAYCQSKLFQLMFTKTLQRKLDERGSKIKVFAVHPGVVGTSLYEGTLIYTVAPWILTTLAKKPEEGATSVIYPCLSEELDEEGGAYCSNCKIINNHPNADDVTNQERLYRISMDLVKKFLEE